uniref:Putative secreted protein n=1 Tax=Anopheles darlingi TaxID=43151 RepID=A0A2M4DGB2_ANODA
MGATLAKQVVVAVLTVVVSRVAVELVRDCNTTTTTTTEVLQAPPRLPMDPVMLVPVRAMAMDPPQMEPQTSSPRTEIR